MAAAATALTVIRGPLLLDPGGYEAALRALSTADLASALVRIVAPGLSTLADRARGGAVLRSSPVAWRMAAYSTDRATVSVCLLTLFGGGVDVQPTVFAQLITVQLSWAVTRWIVTSADDGPAIGPAGTPLTTSYAELSRYGEFRAVPVP